MFLSFRSSLLCAACWLDLGLKGGVQGLVGQKHFEKSKEVILDN